MAKKINNPHNRASQQPQQAQKERQEQVTETQSLTLVKNLIRVSISTVCSLRGIFPQACFQERTYAGMKIYQLDAATRDADTNETVVKDQEAYDLTRWLESGVFEAVELRYLRRMEFIITSPEHKNPREAYSFDLTYPEDPKDESITFGGTKVTTVASTKGQLVKLIRSLIAFGNTLGELPRERFLNIKLWYFEERTPTGWQPKHFREADPAELRFSKGCDDKEIDNKLKIKIGDLTTPHHTLSLRFTGYDNQEQQDDNNKASDEEAEAAPAVGAAETDHGIIEDRGDFDDDEDDDGARSHDGRWSRQDSPTLVRCRFGPGGDEEDEEDEDSHQAQDDDDDEETEVPAAMAIAGRDASRMVSGMMTHLDVAAKGNPHDTYDTDGSKIPPARIDDVYDAAKAWAVALARPTLAGLTEHLDISKELARQCLDRMVDEGLFVKKNFRFHRLLADSPQVCPSSRVLPARKEDSYEERSSGSDGTDVDNMGIDMDVDAADDRNAIVPAGGGGDAGHDSFPSQASSATSDDSETQAPTPSQGRRTEEDRTHSSRGHHDQGQHQRDHTPSTMPPPPAAPGRRRLGGGGLEKERTPEGPGITTGTASGGGRDFATPPIPTSSAPPGLKPVPEKAQQNPLVTMATKRVLDDSALSGNHGDEGRQQDNQRIQQDEEPIDVFNPGKDGMGSDTGYERLALSQASAASSAAGGGGGRAKRKCSLAVNPIHQIVPSKRLRVEQHEGSRGWE